MRTDPPPSVPSASGPNPAATCAPAPPLLPPGVRLGFHGLRLGPKTRLSVVPRQPSSGVFVLPRITAPAALIRATTGASASGTKSAYSNEPRVVRTPLVRI